MPPHPGSSPDPPALDRALHHRLQEGSGPQNLDHMLTPSGSLCEQGHGLSQRWPWKNTFLSADPLAAVAEGLLDQLLSACSHLDPWPEVLEGMTWQPGTTHLQGAVPCFPAEGLPTSTC